MDLDECFKKGFIKKTKIDSELIKSLKEMSDINELTVKSANIDNVNISAYVSMAYDSLHEVLEAICISKGYKVLSHICIDELMQKLFDDFDYDEFDRLRWIRNGISYYGIKVEYNQGREIIKKIFEMKQILVKKYLKNFV
jgi:uncharacterized protein (UPF0332 family)